MEGNQLGRCAASRRGGLGLGLAGLGQLGAGSARGWGIDPTLHGLQTSDTAE